MTTAPDGERRVGGLRTQVVGLVAAWQFLTLTPPLVRRLFTPAEMGAAVGYFPLPGLLLGLLLAATQHALRTVTGPLLASAVVLTLWVIATGALHLDGLLDSCDGLFGGHTVDKRLEIMRDHRIGAFALAGGALLLVLKFAALADATPDWRLLALAPLAARAGLSLAVVTQPYARPQGAGATLKAHASWRQALLAGGLGLAAAALLGGWIGLLLLAVTIVCQAGVVALIRSKLPGLTGDSYGALVELGELAALILIALQG
jgi:adenosylcobinamide-GDP ribazoletransferase